MKLDCINSNKNSEMLQDEQDVGAEEKDFRIKNLLSWQNILSNRQTAADIEEKMSQSRRSPSSRNQSYFLPFLIKQMETMSLSHKQSAAWSQNGAGKTLRFQWDCKQPRIEARNSMANSDIYFPIFSETIHTVLKILL